MAMADSVVAAYPALDQVVFISMADRGAMEMGRGRIGRAESIWRDGFRRAREKDRADWAFGFARNLATLELHIRDRPDHALGELRRFEEHFPMDEMPALNRPYFGLIGMYSRVGGVERSRALLDEAREALPPEEQGVGYRNRLLAARGNIAFGSRNPEEAISLFEEFRRLETCGPCFLDALADAQAEAGRVAEAIASYESWLAQPVFANYAFRAVFVPVVLERLARLYEAQGDAARAAEYYEAFASYWTDPDPEVRSSVQAARSRAADLRASVSD